MLRFSCWIPLSLVFAIFALPNLVGAQEGSEQLLKGHLDSVMMGAFTPEGTRAVTVSYDQTAKLWDLATGTPQRQFTQHTGPIYCLAISSDGTTLVTGAQDNTLRVWDLPPSKPLLTFQDHPKKVTAIALSPGNDQIVSGSLDHSLQIRSTRQKDQIARRAGHSAEIRALAYRNDGAYFASSDASGRIMLWSPYLEAPQSEIFVSPGQTNQLRFVANNQQILASGEEGLVRLWQLIPNASKKLDLVSEPITDWSFISGLSQVVCLAEGGRLFLLNLTNGAIVSEYPKVEGQPTAVAHAPNSSWVGVADQAGNVHLLNFSDGAKKGTVVAHQGVIHDLAIHADSARFATCGSDGNVRVWGQPTAGSEPQMPLHSWQIDAAKPIPANCLTFTPDQQHLLCGSSDGKIRQWNIGSGELVRTIEAHSGSQEKAIRDLLITPNGQTLVSVGADQAVKTWTLADGAAVQDLQHTVPLHRIAISPDSVRAAVACQDGEIRIWDLSTGRLLQSLAGHAGAIRQVAYLSDGQTVVSAGNDKILRQEKTAIVRALAVHQGSILSMIPDSSGAQILTCGTDQRIVLTNLTNGSEIRQFRVATAATASSATSSPAPNSPAAKVAADGKPPEATYQKIKPLVAALRSDNQRVAAGTEAGEVFVWNANNGEAPLQTLSVEGAVTALTYSPDNLKLAVATAARTVTIFGPSLTGVQPQIELLQHQQFTTDTVVTDLLFASDSSSVWTSLEAGQVQQWTYAGIAARRQMNHGGPVYGVTVSGDGKIAVSCSGDQTVRVWDTATGQQKYQLTGHTGPVHAVATSRDETFAVSAGADGTLRLWDLVGGRQLKQLTKFPATMYSLAIHPNGQWLAAAGADRKVHLLDMISGDERKTLEGHSDYIHCVGFDPAGERLLSYGYAGQLKIWSVVDGKLVHESRLGKVGNYAQYSPDGKRLLLSNGDGTARVVPTPK